MLIEAPAGLEWWSRGGEMVWHVRARARHLDPSDHDRPTACRMDTAGIGIVRPKVHPLTTCLDCATATRAHIAVPVSEPIEAPIDWEWWSNADETVWHVRAQARRQHVWLTACRMDTAGIGIVLPEVHPEATCWWCLKHVHLLEALPHTVTPAVIALEQRFHL